ncbi:glycosyltransferase [Schaalia sp. JY-X159]|uniref:glycosyltransferase n=1 Tax=Schaalia sp. JY-X159 TaxID=2758575 RepID=UPI00165E0897|nr:glycosyltransferase [Schaalia sp. JY-X159]
MSDHKGTLIMLTNQFPDSRGDSTFICNEIDGLADHFNQVLIWSYDTPSGPLVTVPENVKYMGPMSQRSTGWLSSRMHVAHSVSYCLKLLRDDLKHRSVPSPTQWARAVVHALRASSAAVVIENHLKKVGIPLSETYLYGFWGMNGGLPLALLGSSSKGSCVRLHGYDIYEERTHGYIPFRHLMFENADLVFPISSNGAQYLAAHYPGYRNRISVQRLGTKDHGAGVGASRDVARVVSCSSIIPLKRVPLIFEVLAAAAAAAPYPLEWIHFGGGSGLEEVRKLVTTTAHPNLLVDLRGPVPNAELMDFYSRTPVDAFINLSETEGVPVSIMEAMSFDIPVVATDVGGTPELFCAGNSTGVLLPASPSAKKAADAVLEVIEKRESYSPRSRWKDLCDAANLTRVLAEKIYFTGEERQREELR